MYTAKELITYTKILNVLYVEDDSKLRDETTFLFEPFFKKIVTACDGVDGLEKYNNELFDIIITDINMPNMNGIDMISSIKEINPEQKIIAISAHNESDILISLIKAGVSSFILKPIIQNEIINTLYPVCRDAHTQSLNLELVNELNEKNSILEEQLKQMRVKNNTIEIKNAQIEKLLEPEPTQKHNKESINPDYFEKDEDEGLENIVFVGDDADDLLEYFQEISEKLSIALIYSKKEEILIIANIFSKVASILLRYSPYLDSLAQSFQELSASLEEHTDEFMEVYLSDNDGMLRLFDAVSSDMERYIERFSSESIAMKNSHHIHEPTMLSIKQIISLYVEDKDEVGEIEFFI